MALNTSMMGEKGVVLFDKKFSSKNATLYFLASRRGDYLTR